MPTPSLNRSVGPSNHRRSSGHRRTPRRSARGGINGRHLYGPGIPRWRRGHPSDNGGARLILAYDTDCDESPSLRTPNFASDGPPGPGENAAPHSGERSLTRTVEARGSNPLTSTPPNTAGQSVADPTSARSGRSWDRLGQTGATAGVPAQPNPDALGVGRAAAERVRAIAERDVGLGHRWPYRCRIGVLLKAAAPAGI